MRLVSLAWEQSDENWTLRSTTFVCPGQRSCSNVSRELYSSRADIRGTPGKLIMD